MCEISVHIKEAWVFNYRISTTITREFFFVFFLSLSFFKILHALFGFVTLIKQGLFCLNFFFSNFSSLECASSNFQVHDSIYRVFFPICP